MVQNPYESPQTIDQQENKNSARDEKNHLSDFELIQRGTKNCLNAFWIMIFTIIVIGGLWAIGAGSPAAEFFEVTLLGLAASFNYQFQGLRDFSKSRISASAPLSVSLVLFFCFWILVVALAIGYLMQKNEMPRYLENIRLGVILCAVVNLFYNASLSLGLSNIGKWLERKVISYWAIFGFIALILEMILAAYTTAALQAQRIANPGLPTASLRTSEIQSTMIVVALFIASHVCYAMVIILIRNSKSAESGLRV